MHKLTKSGTVKGCWTLLAGAVVATLTACEMGVTNPGAITEESLNDATLMEVVALGVSEEFTNIVDMMTFQIPRLTDEAAGTGSYGSTADLRRGLLDWEDSAGEWGQVHETIWTGLSAWDRMTRVDDFNQDQSPLAARVWLLIGLSHRMFGENFCEVVYSVGPSPEEAVLGGVLPRTAAFDSAVVSLNRAITIGNAAGAENIVTAAYGGLAQAYAGLGDWANATAEAARVPTDFEYSAIFNRDAEVNDLYFETHQRAEVGLHGTYAGNLSEADPRVPYTVCGVWEDPNAQATVVPTGAAGCIPFQGADGIHPHVQQEKFDDYGSDVPVVKGTDMRLIEAEAALVAGDLSGFADKINEVREFHGLDPLTGVPSTAGELEYPIAYDAASGDVTGPGVDAWSILDAERQLTVWGEGRRLWDLHRWEHPFLDGGVVLYESEARRASCYPVPDQECRLNDVLKGSTLLTGTGSQTHACN